MSSLAGPSSRGRAAPSGADRMDQDEPPHRRGANLDSDSDNADDGDDDDDDPVIKTIPVYYTPHYLQSLTLLQYPDRLPRPGSQHPLLAPSLRPGADPEPDPASSKITARYKPHSQHLQVFVPIERNEERWNEDAAKEFAKGLPDKEIKSLAKGKGKGRQKAMTEAQEEEKRRAEEEKGNKRLDRLMYGSLVVPDATNYLVGVVKDNALHLSPVTQTYQLRPQLDYLDQIVVNERRAKREAHRNKDEDSDGEGEVSDSELKAEVAKAVQVSIKQQADTTGGGAFGKQTSGVGGNGRAGASLFDPLRAMEGEAWVDLEHFHAETTEASNRFDHMFVSDEKCDTTLVGTTKPTEYLKT